MIKIVSIEEFTEILNELSDEIDEKFYQNLNLGIRVDENEKFHPEGTDDDLLILGEYQVDMLGRGIVIYYGSFMDMYSFLDREELKNKVRETFRHELLHHLENLANLKDLEVEDEKFLEEYKKEKAE